MLATGYSAVKALDILVERGVDRKKILFLALVTVPEGIAVFNEKYSDIPSSPPLWMITLMSSHISSRLRRCGR